MARTVKDLMIPRVRHDLASLAPAEWDAAAFHHAALDLTWIYQHHPRIARDMHWQLLRVFLQFVQRMDRGGDAVKAVHQIAQSMLMIQQYEPRKTKR